MLASNRQSVIRGINKAFYDMFWAEHYLDSTIIKRAFFKSIVCAITPPSWLQAVPNMWVRDDGGELGKCLTKTKGV
jgi:hypothetical protein